MAGQRHPRGLHRASCRAPNPPALPARSVRERGGAARAQRPRHRGSVREPGRDPRARRTEPGVGVGCERDSAQPRLLLDALDLGDGARLDAAVRYVLSPGGGHHVLLPPWVEAFPRASVLVGPARIPRTASGKKLMAMSRVSTFDPSAVLPQFKGQLEFVSFRGLFGAPDHRSPGEGGRDGLLMMLNLMFAMMFRMKDPVDELWTYHVASKTLIGGENLGWMYPKDAYAGLPSMLKGMITPDSVYLFKDARKV